MIVEFDGIFEFRTFVTREGQFTFPIIKFPPTHLLLIQINTIRNLPYSYNQ